MGKAGQKQNEILQYLTERSREGGAPPTVREIAAAVGLRSTATVHAHLNSLAQRGLINRSDGVSRGLALADSSRVKGVPILGTIRAGAPILAVEEVEGYVPYAVGDHGEHFALRIRGDSMIDAGICEGDVVILRQQSTARNGQIVAAILEDEATIKRLKLDGKHVWLMPENPAYQPINGDGAQILGVVTALVRKYE
ncbi:MAG: transcriptional repressor LexA [Oscillospiraceae bacterium]|nr:transcriptional repressor LexA [Oscillospiraceae bacterium]